MTFVIYDQFHLDAISVHKAIQAVADSWQRPPGTVDDVLDRQIPCWAVPLDAPRLR